MTIQPAEIYQSDQASWLEPLAPGDASSVVAWLRAAAAGAGVEAQAALTDEGWKVTLSTATTAAMAAGDWSVQVVATVDGAPHTVRRGGLTVRRSLAFSGTPGAFDDRSQAEKDLAAVEEAIRALTTGAVEYQIGSLGAGGRRVRRVDLPDLIVWRDRLKSDVMREKRAEMIAQGMGDPRRLYVRFSGVL
jgi:hypothetical protein